MDFKQHYRSTILLIVLIINFLTTSVLASYGEYTGSILLRDGSKYENVTFQVDKKFKTLKFEHFNQKVNVSFSKVAKIVDSQNNDISAEVLGEYYKPDAEDKPLVEKPQEAKPAVKESNTDEVAGDKTWISEESKEYQKGKEKLWDAAIMFSPRYSIPSGHYYEGTSGGIGFGADLLIAMTRQLTLRFTYANANIDLDPPFDFISTNTSRYYLSFQYNNPLNKEIPDKSMYYFYSGLGSVSDDLDSYFALTAGTGIIKMLSEDIGFHAEFALDVPGAYDENVSALIFDFKLGVTAVF